MAIQVTQCPSCESTFHANPKLLELAEGRVRCGACLAVFDAIDHFLAPESLDNNESEESVFVGGNPDDFFDPSVFLTRSALSETSDEDSTELPPENEATATESSLDQSADPITDTPHAEPSRFSDFIATEEITTTELKDESVEPSGNKFIDLFKTATEESDAQENRDDGAREDSDKQSIHSPDSGENPNRDREISTNDSDEFDDNHIEFFSAIDESLDALSNENELSELEELAQVELPEERNRDLFESETEDPSPAAPGEEDLISDPASSPEQAAKPEDISLSVSFSYQAPFARPKPEESPAENANGTIQQGELEDSPANDPQVAARQPVLQKTETDAWAIAVKRDIEQRDLDSAVQTGLRELIDSESDNKDPQQNQEAVKPEAIDSTAPDEQVEAPSVPDPEIRDLQEPDSEDSEIEGETSPTDIEEHELSTEAIRARALRANLEDDEALEEIPAENLSALERMATPLELTSRQQGRWGRRIGLGFMFVLLSASLLAQYAWREREVFSVDSRFRSYYAMLCEVISCQLPEYSEIAAIRSENLAVRSHPERDEALMVTVEIRNTAEFEQRFPILILSFNNASDDTIALRELAPIEYLDAGLRNFEFMPALSPVQVSLPIIDPGPDAVNYTLAFRSN